MRSTRPVINALSRRAAPVTLAALLLVSSFVVASAQDIVGPTSGDLGPAGTYVIRNARVVTVSGPDIENGSVVISGGRITAVGASVNAPAGATEIDARGLWVFPGMIDASTNMALVEIGSGVPGSVDTSE